VDIVQCDVEQVLLEFDFLGPSEGDGLDAIVEGTSSPRRNWYYVNVAAMAIKRTIGF
jgi:hypothetical protein